METDPEPAVRTASDGKNSLAGVSGDPGLEGWLSLDQTSEGGQE